MINLSEYEIGQRFKTRGGKVATYKHKMGSWYVCLIYGQHRACFRDGESLELAAYDLIRPIYRVPAETMRIPSAKLTPHIYQIGGGT